MGSLGTKIVNLIVAIRTTKYCVDSGTLVEY